MRVLWGARTRRGLALTMASLILLWIPGLSIVGGLLLSIGSMLMFWDRRPFSPAHRSAMTVAFVLLWVAAVVYVSVFLVFVGAAYAAWLSRGLMDGLEPAVLTFIWDTTIPTELVVVALVFQIRFLLPPPGRPYAWTAGVVTGALVLVATVIAHLNVAAGLGSDFVRMSAVLGVLNQISLARLVEGPGFAMFAYLYYRARANVVPKASPADAPATGAMGPPAN